MAPASSPGRPALQVLVTGSQLCLGGHVSVSLHGIPLGYTGSKHALTRSDMTASARAMFVCMDPMISQSRLRS